MKIAYHLRCDEICDECGEIHKVYGIDAIDSEDNVVSSVPDIFFDISEAIKFVELCNSAELSLIHLPEVIEDLLYRGTRGNKKAPQGPE